MNGNEKQRSGGVVVGQKGTSMGTANTGCVNAECATINYITIRGEYTATGVENYIGDK